MTPTRIFLTLVCLLASACAPNLAEVQDTLGAYHVVATTQGDGAVVVNTNVIALHGDAGAHVLVTAPILPNGARGPVLERKLDERGVLAWRVQLRDREDQSWLRLERIDCTEARLELPELPDCGSTMKAKRAPEIIEKRLYL